MNKTVDLRKCRKGDKLKYRNGRIRYYAGQDTTRDVDSFYRHRVSFDRENAKKGLSCYATRYDGLNAGDGSWGNIDVVAVLEGPGATVPQKPARPDRDAAYLAWIATILGPAQKRRLRAIAKRLNNGEKIK